MRLPAGFGYVRTTSAVDNCLYAETGVENVFIVTWSLILEGGLSEHAPCCGGRLVAFGSWMVLCQGRGFCTIASVMPLREAAMKRA